MKLLNFLLIFAFALVCLFALQVSWLYHTYKLRRDTIEGTVNSFLYQAIEKELGQRYIELEKRVIENSSDTSIHVAFYKVVDKIEANGVVSQHVDMVQQLMVAYNILFNIQTADSIFHSLLLSNRLPFCYQINHIDSTGTIIATAGQEITGGFKTKDLQIVDGEKVCALVKITAPVVFRHMTAILVASVLIFIFIIGCLIYEIKIFIDQHHLNLLRENFTHALSHDMKTPLSTIHAVLIQYEKGNLDNNPEMRKKFSEIAIDQTLNLRAAVDRILTLAYIEKKQLSLSRQSIDLPEMVGTLVDKFSVKSGKAVSFHTVFNLKNSIINADSFYLNNAISNLIDNAIKYSGDTVRIDVECRAVENHIDICVKDNGVGISPNDQLKIFRKFERGAEIKRNRISGFGIGLNYVQQVIEAHGGTVTVFSQEGAGSEFIITLPLNI